MDRFFEATKRYAAAMDSQAGQLRIGVVASYDPNTGTAQVTIQPEGVLSGWLPVMTMGSGNSPQQNALAPGDQVLVAPHEGDSKHGIVLGRLFSNTSRPPAVAGAASVMQSSNGTRIVVMTNGHVLIQDASGAQVSMPGDGTLLLEDASGSTLNMTNNGSIAVSGVLAVTGSIKINGVNVNAP